MRVMVIVKASKKSEAGKMPGEEILTEMGRFNGELASAGILLSGEGLQSSSQGGRVYFKGNERSYTDGPFAETKELIAGFWMLRVKDMQEAIDWMMRCPKPHDEDCHIELRQVFESEDLGDEFTPELREQEASIRAQSLGLGELRFESRKAFTVAGLSRTFSMETCSEIPKLWEKFAPYIGKIENQVERVAYGVCWNEKEDGQFDYTAGVEVSSTEGLPDGFGKLEIPNSRYAIFRHDDHISKLFETFNLIYKSWIPDCGLKIERKPSLERYTDSFDPQTGLGGLEIWIPIES